MRNRLVAFFIAFSLAAQPALAIDTVARQAFMIDLSTRTVLYEKNADEPMHPSSMTKLMTLYILFSRLKDGRIKLDDTLPVSEKAWRTQGSKMFVGMGDKIPVEQLIHGIIVDSGNDACIVVAEGLSGTEDAFVQEMNAMAQKLGMKHTHFDNATGLPDDTHLMTARDLATLAEHVITDFPQYYHYFSTQNFAYNKIRQGNRNLLLGDDLGIDGLKTGHTDAGGYGITLSAQQGPRRLVLVLNGMDTETERKEEGDKLMRYGFREFTNKTLLSAGQKVADADVWFGKVGQVTMVPGRDVPVTVPVSGDSDLKMEVKYIGPVKAPVARGQHIGDLIIQSPVSEARTIPLLAGEDVPALSGISRLVAVLKYYLHHHSQ